MQFRSFAALGVAMIVAGAAACTDNSGPNGGVAGGLYALTNVNGAALPYSYTVSNGGGGTSTVTLQSDVYSLNSNGTYTEAINETVDGSPVTDNESGNWSQGNGVVAFQPSYSSYNPTLSAYQGSLSNGGLFGNNVLVFSTSSGQMVYQHE